MNVLDHLICQEKGAIVMDGALATELETNGIQLDSIVWSSSALITSPEIIRDIYQQYLLAGSRIICTATYQASIRGFEAIGVDQSQALELFSKSVSLVQEAIAFWKKETQNQQTLCLCAGSIGPYGAWLPGGKEYDGRYGFTTPQSEIRNYHAARLSALASHASVDLLLFETIPSLSEACILVEMAIEIAPNKPLIVSFSCSSQSTLCSGELMATAAAKINTYPSVVAIGVNCSSPSLMVALIRTIKEHSTKKCIIYPNSGEGWDSAARVWTPSDDKKPVDTLFQQAVIDWVKAGADIIGGCCRTTPQTIRLIHQTLEAQKGSRDADLLN